MDRESWALNYLRHRKAMLADELKFVRDRVETEADEQIVVAMSAELSEVSALIQAFDGRVLH